MSAVQERRAILAVLNQLVKEGVLSSFETRPGGKIRFWGVGLPTKCSSERVFHSAVSVRKIVEVELEAWEVVV